jgi:hypothetical protein
MKQLITLLLLVFFIQSPAQKIDLSVTPNPAHEIINIKADSEITNVTIFDILGKKILERDGNTTTMDIGALRPGIYIIKVTSNEQAACRKFVKE